MRKIVFIVKPVILKIPLRILTGLYLKEAVDLLTMECETEVLPNVIFYLLIQEV